MKNLKMQNRKKTTVKFYDDFANTWDKRFRNNLSTEHFLKRRVDIIREFANFSGKEKILDVGCGTGSQLLILKNDFGTGIGVDLSRNMLKIAKKVNKSKNIKFILDDAETLKKIPNETIDVLFFSGLIEHLNDPKKFFKNAWRVLKNGGIVIGHTPNRYSPWYSIIAPIIRGFAKHLETDRFYSTSEIKKMLDDVGFNKIKFKLWGFVPPGDISDNLFKLLKPLESLLEKTPLKYLAGGITLYAIK